MLQPTSQYPYKLKKSKNRYGDYPFELITRYSLEQCIRRLQMKQKPPVQIIEGWFIESSANIIRLERYHDDVAEFSIQFKGQRFITIRGALERLNDGKTSVRGLIINRRKAPRWLYPIESVLFAISFLLGFTGFLSPNAFSFVGFAVFVVPTALCMFTRIGFSITNDANVALSKSYLKYVRSIFDYR